MKFNDSDIIGKKFGKLTPIKRVDIRNKQNKNQIHYFCKCDCGNTKNIHKQSLLNGDTKSCGCLRYDMDSNYKGETFIGKNFGRLKVIKQVPKPKTRKNKARYWLCECSCGSDKNSVVSTAELNSGNTKSCGCLASERLVRFNKETKKRYNKYDLTGDYGVGYTLKGEKFYFDIDDYEKIKEYCWRIGNRGYVMCTIHYPEKKYHLLFHRLVMDCPDDMVVDHIDGIDHRHDNRKLKLRICTHQQNLCNYAKPITNTSGYKGVSWCNTHSVWKAQITYKGEQHNLGSFNNIEDAVEARRLGDIKYHGEYRWTEQ